MSRGQRCWGHSGAACGANDDDQDRGWCGVTFITLSSSTRRHPVTIGNLATGEEMSRVLLRGASGCNPFETDALIPASRKQDASLILSVVRLMA